MVNQDKHHQILRNKQNLRPGHTVQHCAQRCVQLESCIVCPPLKLLRATLRTTVAEVESAPTSPTSRATFSPCVHRLQHCVQQCCGLRPLGLRLCAILSLLRTLNPIGWNTRVHCLTLTFTFTGKIMF